MKRLPLVIVALAYLASLVGFSSPVGASVPDLEFTETGCEGYSDSVARLYTAGLGREPEKGGFEYWMGLYTGGDISLLCRRILATARTAVISPATGTLKHGSISTSRDSVMWPGLIVTVME